MSTAEQCLVFAKDGARNPQLREDEPFEKAFGQLRRSARVEKMEG